MDFKPVHIVTNDDNLNLKLARDGPAFRIASEDYTEDEGLHYHYYVEWPVNDNHTLSPAACSAKRRWRKENYRVHRCPGCYDKSFASKCPTCGIFYKLIWCQSEEHKANAIDYIRRKIAADPEREIPSPFPIDE